MTALPDILSPADLPLAELAALRLDGQLYRLGDGFCAVDRTEDATLRAHSVLTGRSRRLIAELGTAAWIWGAAERMPLVHEFCADHGARARPSGRTALQVREMRFGPGDVVDLEGALVTGPLRTAVDLARFRERFADEEVAIVRALAARGGFAVEDCDDVMNRRPNLLEKRRAHRRLAAALAAPRAAGQPEFTR